MTQIIPIKDLKDTSVVSELCHRTNGPIYVTKNGYGDMVIMSMETFERFERLEHRLAMYESIELSEQQIKEGKVADAKESLKNMRKTYGL